MTEQKKPRATYKQFREKVFKDLGVSSFDACDLASATLEVSKQEEPGRTKFGARFLEEVRESLDDKFAAEGIPQSVGGEAEPKKKDPELPNIAEHIANQIVEEALPEDVPVEELEEFPIEPDINLYIILGLAALGGLIIGFLFGRTHVLIYWK